MRYQSDDAPRDFDVSRPNSARMYNYWLGGKDNFHADREAADRLTAVEPQLPRLARENRQFLRRTVRFCAESGVTQFLDIGSGLPTMDSVHEVAQEVVAEPHVVYVDIDPLVVNHATALLGGPNTAAIRGSVTQPGEILAHPDTTRLIDFSEPVAVLLVAVLHFVQDEADPAGAVAALRRALAPGSFLVLSHVETAPVHIGKDNQPVTEAAREMASALEGVPVGSVRTRDDIASFFGDFTMVDPGLVEVSSWRPGTIEAPMSGDVMTVVGGVGQR